MKVHKWADSAWDPLCNTLEYLECFQGPVVECRSVANHYKAEGLTCHQVHPSLASFLPMWPASQMAWRTWWLERKRDVQLPIRPQKSTHSCHVTCRLQDKKKESNPPQSDGYTNHVDDKNSEPEPDLADNALCPEDGEGEGDECTYLDLQLCRVAKIYILT